MRLPRTGTIDLRRDSRPDNSVPYGASVCSNSSTASLYAFQSTARPLTECRWTRERSSPLHSLLVGYLEYVLSRILGRPSAKLTSSPSLSTRPFTKEPSFPTVGLLARLADSITGIGGLLNVLLHLHPHAISKHTGPDTEGRNRWHPVHVCAVDTYSFSGVGAYRL